MAEITMLNRQETVAWIAERVETEVDDQSSVPEMMVLAAKLVGEAAWLDVVLEYPTVVQRVLRQRRSVRTAAGRSNLNAWDQ
jgi:urease gamma subunit